MASFSNRRRYQPISIDLKGSGGGCFTAIQELHLRRSNVKEKEVA
jgi:hypothetical protein